MKELIRFINRQKKYGRKVSLDSLEKFIKKYNIKKDIFFVQMMKEIMQR